MHSFRRNRKNPVRDDKEWHKKEIMFGRLGCFNIGKLVLTKGSGGATRSARPSRLGRDSLPPMLQL